MPCGDKYGSAAAPPNTMLSSSANVASSPGMRHAISSAICCERTSTTDVEHVDVR